ncbi:MAG: ECF-type sigma factor [Xanthomonadales bacterium]|nr:ECF-type sigma factor [Xanthomonadales bacterium]
MTDGVTQLLLDWRRGDTSARDKLLAALYDEMRGIAAARLSGERADHTLQPTALVNEAYEKLVRLDRIQWQDRTHFLAMTARVMREVLVDHARRKGAAKRDWGKRVTLTGHATPRTDEELDLLDLDQALSGLADLDETKARIVELRFFGGLSIEETAEAVDLSPATVKRHWNVARAWLYDALSDPGQADRDES